MAGFKSKAQADFFKNQAQAGKMEKPMVDKLHAETDYTALPNRLSPEKPKARSIEDLHRIYRDKFGKAPAIPSMEKLPSMEKMDQMDQIKPMKSLKKL